MLQFIYMCILSVCVCTANEPKKSNNGDNGEIIICIIHTNYNIHVAHYSTSYFNKIGFLLTKWMNVEMLTMENISLLRRFKLSILFNGYFFAGTREILATKKSLNN